VYRDRSKNILGTIDFSVLFVNEQEAMRQAAAAKAAKLSYSSSGASAELKKLFNTKKSEAKGQKPQAKTFGKKVATAAAETEKVEQKVEKKVESGKKLNISEYEKLLLAGIAAINSCDDLKYGGTEEIKVPLRTKDGSEWTVTSITKLGWTFQHKLYKDVVIDLDTMEAWEYAEGTK
ncbi:MAG: hypothetical protein K2F99_06215, partial [Muribaculaceae bacterium]|nr:hypothetical protein [Muribaculaceae bacterium]